MSRIVGIDLGTTNSLVAYLDGGVPKVIPDVEGRVLLLPIVNEPTAASLAYGMERLAEGIIAVYDLGGGTFDISILRVKDGIFEVLATNGNTHLGGDDFDRTLVEWLLEDVEAAHGADLS